METQLKIKWDGDAPGIAEHRLSLSAFGPALATLLQALRRIASGIVSDALDDPSYGKRGGRLAEKARVLDVQLVTVTEGSLVLDTRCVNRPPPGVNMELLDELPTRALARFFQDVKAESKGNAANVLVRKFLSELPQGVSFQRYEAYRDGTLIDFAEVGKVKLPELPSEPPFFREIVGTIAGVTFEPTKPEIRFATPDGKVTAPATLAQVERAVSLHKGPVRALMIEGPGVLTRLLWVRAGEDAREVASPASRTAAHFQRWDALLARLAQ